MQKLDIPQMEKQALNLIGEARIPVTVDYIARKLKISWDTARSLLLGLAIQDQLKATKTMKSWVFEPLKAKKEEVTT